MKIYVFLLVLICSRCSGLFEPEDQGQDGGSLQFTLGHRLEKPATQEGMGTVCKACSNSKPIWKKARNRDMVRCKDCQNEFHERCILKWKPIETCTATTPNGTVSLSPLKTLFSAHYPHDREFILVTIFRYIQSDLALLQFEYIYHDSRFVDISQVSKILFLIDRYIHNIKFQLVQSQSRRFGTTVSSTTVSVIDEGTITKIKNVTTITLSSVVKILMKRWKILPPEFLTAFAPSYASRSRINLEGVENPTTPYKALAGGLNYMRDLPIENSKILFLFLSHIQKILEHTIDNKMTKELLSLAFGPYLFYNKSEVYVQPENVEEEHAKDEAWKETGFQRRCVLEDLIFHY